MTSDRSVLPIVALSMMLASCSSSSPGGPTTCPECPAGQVCDEATKTCVTRWVPVMQCPAAGCGSNASCRTDNICTCDAGWSDCNGDLAGASSDGCECNRPCDGTKCGTIDTCGASAVNSCGASTSYCNTGRTCSPCPTGKHNCDGVNDCESNQACGSPGCSATTPGACGATRQCVNGSCTSCPAGTFNCDGVGGCESPTECGVIPKGCVPECTGSYEHLCVKNPAQGNRCEECLDNSHCRANPRANGPTCDTSDLAGTGFNFCICASEADCTSSTVGHVCRAAAGVANPKLKQCTCDTDQDCAATHPICEGSLFKRCQKRCAGAADCLRGVLQGTCDPATGKCSFPDF